MNGTLTCTLCDTEFTTQRPFLGKNPKCPDCRQQAPKVPPVKITYNDGAKRPVPAPTHQKLKWSDFAYPIKSYHDGDGHWSTYSDLSGVGGKIDPFDQQMVDEVYFSQKGQNDEEEWVLIFKRKDGIYVYFRAHCDYTGFDCQGGGTVAYANYWDTFVDRCLDTTGRAYLWANAEWKETDKTNLIKICSINLFIILFILIYQ